MVKMSLVASSIALAVGSTTAQASLVSNVYGPYTWSTDRANFTMLDSGGYVFSGTNDIRMVWDGDAYSASSDYSGPGIASNVTMSSTTQFYAKYWTAHDIQMFLPGSYTFDAAAGSNPGDSEMGTLSVTVGTGQLGMHVLFDWGQHKNQDMFVVFSRDSVFGPGIARSSNPSGCDSAANATVQNCLWDGPYYAGGLSSNKPAGSTVWMLASGDGNGDGMMGIPGVLGSTFQGLSANFNADMTPTAKPVPVPAAVWLFGSGLLGLFGVARRRTKTV